MNKIERSGYVSFGSISRLVVGMAAAGAMLLSLACGGGEAPKSTNNQPPTGYSKDIKEQLKYDDRVESFDEENDQTLVVNVKDVWLSSPEGMRQRTMEQWFSLWSPSKGSGAKIIVRHNGDDVASWSGKGYEPAKKRKEGESSGVARSS